MYFSKKLFTKTVALAAICASIATASFAAPQGTYDTSEIHVTGQASRSVAPSYAILTLGITSENTNINAAKSNNDRIMSELVSRLSNLGIAKKDIYTSFLLAIFSWLFVMGVYYLKPYIKNNFSWDGISLGFQYFIWQDWVDILTTSIFLVGMWLMAKRKLENWIYWIVGDIISVPLYYHKKLIFSSFQYFIFTIIAILAYIEWKKHYNNQQTKYAE